jgi:hypothetical protein
LVTEDRVSRETLSSVASDICTSEELIQTANAYWDRELKMMEE